MSQTHLLIDQLKHLLKENGHTYKDVAQTLKLSEASVKRKFSEYNFSLNSIEKILVSINLDFNDLTERANRAQLTKARLNFDQETRIAADPKLLLITVLVLCHWRLDDILQQYHFSKSEVISYLLILDKLKLVELKKDNRIKLLIPADFSWIPGGPIQSFFINKISSEFINGNDLKGSNSFVCLNAMLTEDGLETIHKSLKILADKFNDLSSAAKHEPITKKQGTSMMLAIRDWQFDYFKSYRK